MIDAIDDRDRAKRMTETRQNMNCTYAGRMPGKVTLSKIIKICDDIEKNMPEKIVDRIEISPETAILIRTNPNILIRTDYKKGMFSGNPFCVIPDLKVPYRVKYIKETR